MGLTVSVIGIDDGVGQTDCLENGVSPETVLVHRMHFLGQIPDEVSSRGEADREDFIGIHEIFFRVAFHVVDGAGEF